MPVVWGASLLGMPIQERVAGADLVPRLVEVSQSTGWRIHVFGSSSSVADRATALFAAPYPNAAVSIDPGPRIPDPSSVDDRVLDDIAAVDADILCVAFGNPKQERFIEAHRDRLRVPVMIGVGGSLDMLVGERKRAPRWMQRTGTEWIARMVQEPRAASAAAMPTTFASSDPVSSGSGGTSGRDAATGDCPGGDGRRRRARASAARRCPPWTSGTEPLRPRAAAVSSACRQVRRPDQRPGARGAGRARRAGATPKCPGQLGRRSVPC